MIQGCQFFKIFDEHQLEFIILARGDSDDVYMIGKVASFQIQNLLVAYKERFDKDNFIKNLLLDNLLLVDIYNRAKKLHIAANARRVVFLVDTAQEKDNASMECIRSLLGTKTGDFITAVDEKSIIVVKELASEEGYQEMEKTAKQILNVLPAEKQEVSERARLMKWIFGQKQEFKEFLPSMDSKPEARMAFLLLYWTGMRIGELLALTYEDIDLEKRCITINKSYQRLNGKDMITPPKTPKSNRQISIPPFLAEELKEYCSMLYGITANEECFDLQNHSWNMKWFGG